MTKIDNAVLVTMFDGMAAAMAENRDLLCKLDGVIGDADHGITMDLGFSTVKTALTGLDIASGNPTEIFNLAAKSFLNAVGASSGPLYATAFMRAGASLRGKVEMDDKDFIAAFTAMAGGIVDRGKAVVGEKTMVDAWLPASEAARIASEAGSGLRQSLEAGLEAARQGAEKTKQMVASKGRSARLGERSLGHVDPGAASAVLLIEAMIAALPD